MFEPFAVSVFVPWVWVLIRKVAEKVPEEEAIVVVIVWCVPKEMVMVS